MKYLGVKSTAERAEDRTRVFFQVLTKSRIVMAAEGRYVVPRAMLDPGGRARTK